MSGCRVFAPSKAATDAKERRADVIRLQILKTVRHNGRRSVRRRCAFVSVRRKTMETPQRSGN